MQWRKKKVPKSHPRRRSPKYLRIFPRAAAVPPPRVTIRDGQIVLDADSLQVNAPVEETTEVRPMVLLVYRPSFSVTSLTVSPCIIHCSLVFNQRKGTARHAYNTAAAIEIARENPTALITIVSFSDLPSC